MKKKTVKKLKSRSSKLVRRSNKPKINRRVRPAKIEVRINSDKISIPSVNLKDLNKFNWSLPSGIRVMAYFLAVIMTTAGIGYAVAFAANTVIGNNIVTSGNLTVGGTTTFNTIGYTWPSADGSSGQTLSTNGSGVLSWAAGGGSGTVGASTAIGQVPYYGAVGTALTATSSLFISTGGKVGVGTTSPSQLFSVQGNSLFSGDISSVANITATGTITIGHSATTSAKLFIADGVATGTPGIPGTTQNLAWFTGNGSYPTIGLENTSNGVRMGMVEFTDENGAHGLLATFTNHPLAFEVNAGGGGSPALWIATNNNIGIGTTTPSEVLSVIGNISMSGNLLPTVAPAVTAQSSQAQASSTIDGTGFDAVPSGHSIALGTDGFPVIAYRNATDSSLKVTKCGDANCYTATTTTTVIGAGLVGGGDQSISIAVGTDGLPWITYGKATENSLHLVRCATASCSATTSDLFIDGVVGGTAPNVGTSTSIVITNDQTPKIAYYDETDGELRLATCLTLSCSSYATSTLDGAGVTDVGAFNSMAVLPDDSLIISYYDITNGDLKIAKCVGPTCGGGVTLVIKDSTGDVGKYTSIAIGTDNLPIISYYDVTNANLKLAHCTVTNCNSAATPIIIDSTGDVGQYTSIARSIGDGFAIISYYDVTNSTLKTAKLLSAAISVGTATIVVLDSANAGKYSSVIIGTDGMPVIAYYASGSTDLMMVKCNQQSCSGVGTGYLVGGSDIGSLGKFFRNAYMESLWAKQISIQRFDLAEDYYSRESLNPGEIVSLDTNESLHIKKASNDGSRVIGIVSTEPALVLSDFAAPASNDKNYPIALAGRVPVKVNSEGGAVSIGDPITLSSQSGIGKRASEGEKTIGYALDSFNGTAGTIRVFVSLNGENISLDNASSNSLLGQLIGVVKNWMESMKVTIEDGIMAVQNLVADKVTTKKLCLDDVCIDKTQLQSILTASGNPQPAAPASEPAVETPVASDPAPETSPADNTSTSTPTQ